MRLPLRGRAVEPLLDGDTAAPRPAAPVRLTVQREPVLTLDGRLLGHSIEVGSAATALYALGSVPGTLRDGVPTPDDDALHELYLGVDLPRLVADRYLFLPATRAMLDGYVPVPVTPGRLVLDLPPGYERWPDAVERAAVLGALGLRLTLLGYRGTAEQEALLPYVSFVVVHASQRTLPLAAVVSHVHTTGLRVLAVGVQDHAVVDDCWAAGVDAVRNTRPALLHARLRSA